jgi:hypothetical protein
MTGFLEALFAAPIGRIILIGGLLLLIVSYISFDKHGISVRESDRRSARLFGLVLIVIGLVFAITSQNVEAPSSGVQSAPGPNMQAGTAPNVPSSGTTYVAHLVEQFNSNDRRWPIYEETSDQYFSRINSSVGPRVYRVELSAEDTGEAAAWHAIPTASEEFSDFVLEADFLRAGGSESVLYGLLFRQVERQGSYVFFINDHERTYGVSLFLDNNWRRLVEMKFSSMIEPGSPNRLSVTASGSHFELRINGRKVDEFDSVQFTRGRVGVVVNSLPAGESVALEVDNFFVAVPDD